MEEKKLQEQLVEKLRNKKWTLATAESLTGGLLASKICEVSGASDVFAEGLVTYSNKSKVKRLGVKESSIEKYSPVSREVAEEMARGARKCLGADIGLSTTGVAGPDNFDSDGNPKGLFYVALSYGDTVISKKFNVEGSRNEIREQAAECALLLLAERLEG